jgi:iron-sulfur cluster repair protein YtfE (RIC family)
MVNAAGALGEPSDPTLRLLGDLTRQGTLVVALQATHDKFRAYHEDCVRLVVSVGSHEQGLGELLQALDAYAALFHEQHQAEDDYLFPALRRAEPALDEIVEQLANQHVQLAAQLAAVLEHAGRISSVTATEASMAQLLGQLREFHGLVETHLLLEEDATVPIVSAWTSWPL